LRLRINWSSDQAWFGLTSGAKSPPMPEANGCAVGLRWIQIKESGVRNMKTAIVYRSLRGTTKRYAEWLHESIDSDIYNINRISPETLNAYETLILCSCVYMGTIAVVGFVKKNWELLDRKEVILVAVGSVSTEKVTTQEDLGKLPREISNRIKYWKIPGAFTGKGSRNIKQENIQPVIDYMKGFRQHSPHLEVVNHRAGPGVNVAYRIVRSSI
jgi:flavodoxin